MKKLFLAVMALVLTVSVSAQQVEDEIALISEDAGNDAGNKKECVYSPETRAMMKVDKIASNLQELKDGDRNKLVKHFTEQIERLDALRAAGTPIDWDAIRVENNEKLHKVLGDNQYIEYLENMQAKLLKKIAKKNHKKKMHFTATEVTEEEGK